MNTRVDQLTAPSDSLWVPHFVSIADFRGAIQHIQSVPALDVISKCIGISRLLDEAMWNGFYGKASDAMAIFYDNQDEIEDTCGISVDDVYEPFKGLEEYLSTTFLEQLTEEKQIAFREEGFTIAAWTSVSHAVIASTTGREYPAGSPAATRYWNTLSAMDIDPGLEEYYWRSRENKCLETASRSPRTEGNRRAPRYKY